MEHENETFGRRYCLLQYRKNINGENQLLGNSHAHPRPIQRRFDPCPFPTPEWDGLTLNWLSHEKVFCNPPYNNLKAWARKCYETLMEAKRSNQAVQIHLLIPARTDTKYFHEYIRPFATLHFIQGRLKFRDLTGTSKKPTSAPFPSMVCVYQHV